MEVGALNRRLSACVLTWLRTAHGLEGSHNLGDVLMDVIGAVLYRLADAAEASLVGYSLIGQAPQQRDGLLLVGEEAIAQRLNRRC